MPASSRAAADISRCIPLGHCSPACSAIDPQFTRASPASRPRTNAAIRPPRFDPGEPAANPEHQLIEFPPPALQVYAEASGHRTIFC
jgi:hypothetical protein